MSATNIAPNREALTAREVADRLAMPYKSVLRLIKQGQIRARFTGRQYVVPVAALEDYLAGAGIPR